MSQPRITRAWEYLGRIVVEMEEPDPESPVGVVLHYAAYDPETDAYVRDDTLWEQSDADLVAIPLEHLDGRCETLREEARDAGPRP